MEKDDVENSKEFFEERERMTTLLRTMASTNKGTEEMLREAEKILEKYQEQPQLLDPALEEMLKVVMDGVRGILKRWQESQNEEKTTSSPMRSYFSKFKVFRDSQMDRLMSVLYLFCKTRGYKSIVKFLPHDVSDLEPVVHMLHSQDRSDFKTWQTRYGLLIWLSILVRVPFDLSSIDSSLFQTDDTSESYETLVTQLVVLGKTYLSDSGATRDAAAIMLGQLLTRPDMSSTSQKNYLESFFEWSSEILSRLAKSDRREITDVFLTTGVFRALTEILKHGDRSLLLSHISQLFDSVLDVTDAISKGNVNTLQRKMTTKLAQRIGLTFLPPRVPKWRYERGERSLLTNLSSTTLLPKKEDLTENKKKDVKNEEEEEEEEEETAMAEEIEDVIDLLLSGLKDADTIVRWSAAKGIGRITGRLPSMELADEVVKFVMDLFHKGEGPAAWHGGCLAMAELARRGLLLPSRLESIVPLIEQALQYDVKRGTHSVGAHVRDAGCYVCWAFARAYEPNVMKPHVHRLSQAMMVTAICDREVNCRRAASAAFQENVGRQGNENFPHGIEILTAADYFSLGNRRNAYTEVSVQVAKFPEYRTAIVDHLVKIKLRHWDPNLRFLSADALAKLTPLCPKHMRDVVLPFLCPLTLDSEVPVRHGATLAVSKLIVALSQEKDAKLSTDMQKTVRNMVMKIEKKRLYRGKGGTTMREAVCSLIRGIAVSKMELSLRAQERLLQTLHENLQQVREETREEAARAMDVFAKQYWTLKNAEIARKVIEPLLTSLRADVCSSRSGAALGLGVLPSELVCCDSDLGLRLVKDLVRATKPFEKVDFRSAEARRDAVRALSGICKSGVITTTVSSSSCARLVFDAIMESFEDYETTDRGDVGSLVRSAAVDAVKSMVDSHLSTVDPERVVSVLLKQCCEKIDSVRSKAGQVLFELIHRSDFSLQSESVKILREAFPKDTDIQFSSVTDTFPRLQTLLCRYDSVISGMTLSCANRNAQSLVKAARAAFLGFANSLQGDVKSLLRLCDRILDDMKRHRGESRVSVRSV